MRLSELTSLDSFALLGPGFARGGLVLVTPLREAGHGQVVLLTYEQRGADAQRFAGSTTRLPALALDVPAAVLAPQLDEAGHAEAVAVIRAAIAAGDVYQVNLTLRAQLGREPGAAVFAALCRRGLPRFAAWVRLPDGREIVSASPELLLEIQGDLIRTEPMKGTAPAGCAALLEESAKDRAELAMITDLLRNDLARVCVPKTVRVVSARRLVELPYAVQAVSEIEGQLPKGALLGDVLDAIHPGGSITGAPKAAARAIIQRLERSPRGAYCGALGLVDENHTVVSLLIRTASRPNAASRWTYGVGGAIVWESDAGKELDEARLKLGALG